MSTVAFEEFLSGTLQRVAGEMGLDTVDLDKICETDYVQRFEFQDPEAFRQDIYRSFGAYLGPKTNEQVSAL